MEDSSYDPNLTYDERRRLRKLKKEMKMRKNSGYESSGSSSSDRSSSYSRFPVSTTQSHFQNGSKKTTPPPAMVGDETVINKRQPSDDKKTSFGSGKSSSAPISSSSLPASHSIISTQHPMHGTRVVGGNSTAATKPRANTDGAVIKPVALRMPDSTQPITVVTTTARSTSPHSPVVVGKASFHLSGIIARQKERERSSSSPLSPPPSGLAMPPAGNKASTFESKGRDFEDSEQQDLDQSELSPSGASSATPSRSTPADLGNLISNFQFTSSSEDRTGSRLSALSSSSSFTIDNLDQLLSPLGLKPTSPPRSFAANLTFVDPTSPVSPSPVYGDELTTIRGPRQKTNVVYGSHEEDDASAVTRIPSSGFFDPSQTQSQADFLSPSSPPRGSMVGIIEEEEEKKKEPQSPEKKKGGKDGKKARKSPFRHFRKGSVDKAIVEEEEVDVPSGEAKKKDGKKASKKKGEANIRVDLEGIELDSPEHKTVVQSPLRKAYSSRLPPQHPPSPSKPTTSQSFREEHREKSFSPVWRGLGGAASASPSPSPGRSREETPESGTSSESGSQGKKRRASFAKRMMSLVVGGGRDSPKSPKPTMANPVVLKNYRVYEEEEPTLAVVPPFNEVSVDRPSKGPLLGASRLYDEDDLTSVSAPTLTVIGPSGDFSGGNLRSHGSSASLLLSAEKSAKSDSAFKRTSSLNTQPPGDKKKASTGKKKFGVKASSSKGVKPLTKSTLKESPRKTSATPKSSPKSNPNKFSPNSSPVTPRKTSSVSKLSPNSSPVTPRKISSTTAAKGSPISSPLSPHKNSPSSPRKVSATTKTSPGKSTQKKSSTTTDSPKASPRKVSGLAASTASPLTSRKVGSNGSAARSPAVSASTTNKAGTGHKNSPVVKRMTTKQGSIVTTKITFRASSPTGTKKAGSPSSLTTSISPSPPQSPSPAAGEPSPLTKRKVVVRSHQTSPKSSPITTRVTASTVGLSKVSSPLVTRKTSSASTRSDVSKAANLSVSAASPQRGSPKTSPRSSPISSPRSSVRQAAPPLLARVSLGSQSSPSRSTGSGDTPTRNPAGQRPPKLVMPGKEGSTSADSPSFSRFSKGRQPIKTKTPDPSKVLSPTPSKHSTVKNSPPTPDKDSSPDTRKRRVGVSLSQSPLTTPSPTVERRGFNLSSLGTFDQLETIPQEMTLMESIGQKLSHLETEQSRAKNSNPSDFMTSSVFDPTSSISLQSSVKVEGAPQPHPESPSPPDDFFTPESSPLVSRSANARDGKAKKTDKKLPLSGAKAEHEPLSHASKSEISLSSFTSARPPKPPSKKLSAPPTQMSTKGDTSKSVSSTGMNRPRMLVVAGASAKPSSAESVSSKKVGATSRSGKELSAATKSKSTSDVLKPPSGSTARESTLNRSMRTRSSSRIRPITAANTGSRRYSVAPALSQPVTSGTSTADTSSFSRQAVGQASGRKSMRKASSGDLFGKKIRPGSSSTLTRERKNSTGGSSTMQRERKLSGGSRERRNSGTGGVMAEAAASARSGGRGGASGVFASMRRKSSTALRPGNTAGSSFTKSPATMSMRRMSSATQLRPGTTTTTTTTTGGSSFTKSAATKSMRLPRNSVVGQRGSTLRKSSRGAPPPPAVTAEPPVSPSRRGSTLKRMSSTGTLRKQSVAGGDHMMDAFDHISSQASGLLTSSDHRRAVRPKLRQKASTTHLKMLHQRKDVSSSIGDKQEEEASLDPNTYSTYMSKKNLAPSAMAGLAANVDFSTVKLRKTGTLQQMLDTSSSPVDDGACASPAPGNEFNTSHPTMLLQIKGRRNIQTRLVEPCLESLNSGDVFVALSKDKLFQWMGKSANVIERARASDVAMRIIHKKELGCKAPSVVVIKEEDRATNQNSQRMNKFWDLLGCGSKRAVKSSESVPGDEVYEKAVCLATTVYVLEGDKETAHFVPMHEGSVKMISVKILNSNSILLFDFHCEVYVWLGQQCQANLRRKAAELGKQIFDAGCRPPIFNLRNSPARASGRYRPKTSIAGTSKSPRHSVINASGRRMSRVTKEVKPRPAWALFGRLTEGSEHILFREKFTDWPEPGRIIKFKGEDKKMKEHTALQIELLPADVDKMMKDSAKFEGLRLEGDNIYRGLGNYKVSKSSFSCNRVRTIDVKKWVIKEFDNVEVPGQHFGVFYDSEAYVVRWGYQISVVRELEGLVPGQGMFARDRAYQKSLQEAREGKGKAEAAASKQPAAAPNKEFDDSDASDEEEEEGVLESGGRDRCAYFFWQGDNSTVNEKGASALMTMELDKERGPQVRVTQGKEPPAFLALFNGGMVILNGRSETDHLQARNKRTRIFCARVQMKNEACLVEATPSDDESLSTQLRSRGCYVIQQVKENRLFLWYGSKCTRVLKKSANVAAKMMKNRLNGAELIRVNEGNEPNDLCCLLGNKKDYIAIDSDARFHQYCPRLFALSSITGEFMANEVLFPARSGDVEAFTFDQSDLYDAVQPAIFLVDGHTEVYVWLGWWPRQENQLLREANATTGSSHSHWLRDKKLALETALQYVKACHRTRTPRAYMVSAGTEHERFQNLFPYWEVKPAIQNLNCKGSPTPKRVDAETELAKYSRTEFKLEELKGKPLPEGVDPSKLETYLSNQDFKVVFKVDRADFAKMPQWKQTKRKKEVGLF